MTQTNREPPIINAPWPVAGFAILLLAVHLVSSLLPEALQVAVFLNGALFPDRFWALGPVSEVTGLPAYSGVLEAVLPMITSGFLHADWAHVLVNAVLLIVLAKPLLELFRRVWPGREPAASILLLTLFLVSQLASSLIYLGANYPDGPPIVGASGGVSGLLAAFLMIREGPKRWLLSRRFLVVSSLFIVANALISVVGPVLLGINIGWEAHVGGYIGGALFMRAVLWWIHSGRA